MSNMFQERFSRFRALLSFFEKNGKEFRIEYADAVIRKDYHFHHALSRTRYGYGYDVLSSFLDAGTCGQTLSDRDLMRIIYREADETFTALAWNGTRWVSVSSFLSRHEALCWLLEKPVPATLAA